ncbi:hypothetical protein PENFLA_c023G07651 [Penicillium flavigenum]|uniref:Uncharacterized protein n=1 Tax=Penicillium flavigenum TaxID=254877 RepID=A0A1V6SUX3_9EURO|nr:hypothetical protein PENFLA_c023G07651 [Penicillium flavigenum]
MVDGEIMFVPTIKHSQLPKGDSTFFAKYGDSGALVYTEDSHASTGATEVPLLQCCHTAKTWFSRCGRTDKTGGDGPIKDPDRPAVTEGGNALNPELDWEVKAISTECRSG